ncbi:hypothetical protein HHI36_022293 [Cryptolaemus montrouzieri]|uniref:Uncharacterized protein n=1 Tax=Cryptolaemus montrouzieri TaxID=559131 RepID=A0ABD2MZF9_9CUCU
MATVSATAENKGKAPTFQRGMSESVIDIAFANAKMSEYLKDWRVMKEDSLSLHNYITFGIYSKKQPVVKGKRQAGWNVHKLDSATLKEKLDRCFAGKTKK